jgi:hypothetical protein
MKKILVLSCFLIMNFGYAQKKYDEKNIELTCITSERHVLEALFNLGIKTENFTQNYSIETLREVHAESMSKIKDKLTKVATDLKIKSNSGFVDLGLNVANDDFKYGLCQKYLRKEANINTISKEAYFLCRKTITESSEQRPAPCF